mmetsp:Transcript_24092/g.60333  ORF Transcript_24092/g.60333 Transcript_24092/m.60333 type:complete len:272 (-) Transcript_24092:812-1627(-)
MQKRITSLPWPLARLSHAEHLLEIERHALPRECALETRAQGESSASHPQSGDRSEQGRRAERVTTGQEPRRAREAHRARAERSAGHAAAHRTAARHAPARTHGARLAVGARHTHGTGQLPLLALRVSGHRVPGGVPAGGRLDLAGGAPHADPGGQADPDAGQRRASGEGGLPAALCGLLRALAHASGSALRRATHAGGGRVRRRRGEREDLEHRSGSLPGRVPAPQSLPSASRRQASLPAQGQPARERTAGPRGFRGAGEAAGGAVAGRDR